MNPLKARRKSRRSPCNRTPERISVALGAAVELTVLPLLVPLLRHTTLTALSAPPRRWAHAAADNLAGLTQVRQQLSNPVPPHARTGALDVDQPELALLTPHCAQHHLGFRSFRRS